jgi:hypothetical protein
MCTSGTAHWTPQPYTLYPIPYTLVMPYIGRTHRANSAAPGPEPTAEPHLTTPAVAQLSTRRTVNLEIPFSAAPHPGKVGPPVRLATVSRYAYQGPVPSQCRLFAWNPHGLCNGGPGFLIGRSYRHRLQPAALRACHTHLLGYET